MANAQQGQSQTKELVQERRTDVQSLPQQARSRIQSLSNLSVHKRVHPVRLPEWLYDEEKLAIYVNRNSREIRFSPGEGGEELHIIRSGIEVISDSAYAWAGDVYFSSGANPIGDAVFIQDKEGEITGNIDVEGLFFQVHPLGASRLHAIVEFDEEEMARENEEMMRLSSPYHDSGAKHSETVYPTQNEAPELEKLNLGSVLEETSQSLLQGEEDFPSSCSKRLIRVLVLYTPAAASYGNINNIIAQAIEETHQSYWNSGVGGNMAVILQHSQQINLVENDIENDLNYLTSNDPTAQILRNQHDADVVILLTGAGVYGSTYGVAGTLHLENHRAYAIVDVSKATGPRYTFAHELGHIQAAQHHPNDPVHPNPLYSYGYGHRFSYSCGFFGSQTCKRSTIMAYTPGDYSRIKNYSNPYKTYGGKAVGIVDQRENFKVLNNTRVTISNFEDAEEPSAGILYTAGNTHPYGQNFTFDDNTCGGSGSISYQWRKSYGNPYSFANVESTSSSWFVALSPGTWYIKLTVNTSTGQSSSKVVSVQAQEEEGCQPGYVCEDPKQKVPGPGTEDEGQHPEAFALLPAYPNPFNPATQIAFELPETRHVTLAVYDIAGRETVILADQTFTAGRHRVAFDAAGLSSGMYFVRMQAGEFVQTQTITLLK